MTPRIRLEARIPLAMKHQLMALARQRHIALTDLVEAALQRMLSADAPTDPSVTARLNRVLREIRDLQRGLEILEETLGLFINVYFSTTPEVPPEHEEAARRLGGRRYARFLKVLEGKIAREKGARYADTPAPDSAGPRA